jgi:signal transduction histidine kinase
MRAALDRRGAPVAVTGGVAEDGRAAPGLPGAGGLEQPGFETVAAVAHDMLTPLASVRALIELAADSASDTKAQARYLGLAWREASYLGQLVEGFLGPRRVDYGSTRYGQAGASLQNLVSDTLASFQHQAERQNVRLIAEIPADVEPVSMGLIELRRVICNLIANALRHTPAGGTVLVRMKPRGEVVQVEVADTGEGIDAEDLPRVFEPSFRGENAPDEQEMEDHPGLGLGLAIVRELVEGRGGEIEVQSRIGEGTSFRFTLTKTSKERSTEGDTRLGKI